jgi:hypothetical protein
MLQSHNHAMCVQLKAGATACLMPDTQLLQTTGSLMVVLMLLFYAKLALKLSSHMHLLMPWLPHRPHLQTGTLAGLVRRLLLLEAVQHPTFSLAGLLLSPALRQCWQQQHAANLSMLARPGHCSSSSSSSSRADGRDGDGAACAWLWHPAIHLTLFATLQLSASQQRQQQQQGTC